MKKMIFVLLNLLTPMAVAGQFGVGTGVDYSTGKYGGTTATDIVYVPVTGKYMTDDWLFKLTVPYISVTGLDGVIRGIGHTTTSGMGGTGRGGGGMMSGGGGTTIILREI